MTAALLTAQEGARPQPSSQLSQPAGSMMAATASLVDASGRNIGGAHLRETPHGVLIKLELKNATPGPHGFHIHETGKCERPSFASAGGHFNPTGRKHGLLNPDGPHAGDLPNIEVPSTTNLSIEHFASGVTLKSGPRSLLDTDGSAVMIHSAQDDYMSDPAGNAGDRLACGEIKVAAAER
jgi:Cu-Zn family superoxide dismutase